jgi:hypothetical protein
MTTPTETEVEALRQEWIHGCNYSNKINAARYGIYNTARAARNAAPDTWRLLEEAEAANREAWSAVVATNAAVRAARKADYEATK